jgi:hypothetical protein
MSHQHQPDDQFVEKLEWQIGREVRRRNRATATTPAAPRSRARVGLALTALIVVSMGVGAAVVAVAYQAETNLRRDLLSAGLERRAELARQRLALAAEQQQAAERRVSLGVEGQQAVLDARVKVAEAQAQLRTIELQLDEVRLTGREPLTELSAPLVNGRDFLGDRWQTETAALQTALEIERLRLQETEKRIALGVAEPEGVDVSRAKILAIESAIETLGRRTAIRRQFLAGELDAAGAELRALTTELEQRLKTLTAKMSLARKAAEAITRKVQLGTAERVEAAEANLRQLELQTEVAKAELDLALARRQLDQRRGRR